MNTQTDSSRYIWLKNSKEVLKYNTKLKAETKLLDMYTFQ